MKHEQWEPAVVIDTDPGIDDVVALALAARSPELDIVAVTTTYGNARLETTTRNAREVLRLAGRSDITVWPGADKPLQRPLVTAPKTHGESGVGYAPVPAAAGDEEPDEHVLLRLFDSLAEPITLITLGPLTNLAHALAGESALVRARVRRHIGMFGTVHERGNADRWADFNSWCDPEAADRVLRAELNTLMVGLDVTRRMVLEAHTVRRFASSSDPLVSWLGRALQFYVEFHASRGRLNGCVVNDVLTLGELLSPGLLTTADLRLHVDLDDGENRGRTSEGDAGTMTATAMQVDVARMRRLLRRVFGNDWIGGR